MTNLRWYSVLLVYDSSISEGCETFYDWARAASPDAARRAVVAACIDHNRVENGCEITESELHCELVIRGKHTGLDVYAVVDPLDKKGQI